MPLSASSALHAVTKNIVNAAESPNPLQRIKTVLRDLTNRFHSLGVLVHEEEGDEVLLHASQNLTIYQSITACRTGGHIALIGVLTGFAGEVAIPALFSNQIRISGISIGSRADQEHMIRAITASRLKPVIDRRFLLQEIVAAFKYYESQKHFGKVCLEL